MTTQVCKANIPASCRYHGIGSTLSNEGHALIKARIDGYLNEILPNMKLASQGNESLLRSIQSSNATMLWKNEIKRYNHEVKMDAAKIHTLKTKEEKTTSDAIFNKAVKLYNRSNDLEFETWRSDLIPFKAVIYPIKSKNNCHKVSEFLLTNFSNEDFGSDKPLELIRRDAPDSRKPRMFWHHAAILVEKENTKYVVDYTLNQFDKKAPVPFVGTIAEWETALKEANGEEWTEEHLSPWSVTGGETKDSF